MALMCLAQGQAWAQVPTAPPATASDESPTEKPTNIMIGYQYLHDFSWDSSLLLGFSVSLSQRIKTNMSLVGEASGGFGDTANGFSIQRFAFLGGVKVFGGEGQIRPFFQVLAGLSRQGGDVGELNAPALQPGGGADFFMSDRWTFRAQGDFRFIYEENELRTAYRVSGGVVFYLGKAKKK